MHQELCQELCGRTTPLHTDVALLCSGSAWRNISVLLVHFACASWMCAGAFLAFLCTPELGWVCSKAGKMFFGFPWWLFLQAKSRVVLLPSTGSCQEQGVYSPYLLFALWECLQDFVMAHWVLFFIPGSWVLNKIRKKSKLTGFLLSLSGKMGSGWQQRMGPVHWGCSEIGCCPWTGRAKVFRDSEVFSNPSTSSVFSSIHRETSGALGREIMK